MLACKEHFGGTRAYDISTDRPVGVADARRRRLRNVMTPKTGYWRGTPGAGALRRLGRAGPFNVPFPIHPLMLAILARAEGVHVAYPRTTWLIAALLMPSAAGAQDNVEMDPFGMTR